MAQSESQSSSTDAALTIPGDTKTEVVDGGELVYIAIRSYSPILERETVIGQRLVGFRAVSDWDAIERELDKRGYNAGDLHHLPEFDQ